MKTFNSPVVSAGVLLASLCYGRAQTFAGQPPVKIEGIVSVENFKSALMDLEGRGRSKIVGENLRLEKFEVRQIRFREGEIDVFISGSNSVLKLPPAKTAESAPVASEQGIRLADANIVSVLSLYMGLTGRTILQHPTLPASKISLAADVRDKAAAAAALEKALQDRGIVMIPDGEKFTMVFPAFLTNSPRVFATNYLSGINVPKDKQKEPLGMIYFGPTDLRQAIEVYASLTKMRAVNADKLPAMMVYLTTMPLTAQEAAHALEVLFIWSGFKVEKLNDKEFKLVPL